MDIFKYWPDDGAREKVRGSPKLIQFIPGGYINVATKTYDSPSNNMRHFPNNFKCKWCRKTKSQGITAVIRSDYLVTRNVLTIFAANPIGRWGATVFHFCHSVICPIDWLLTDKKAGHI